MFGRIGWYGWRKAAIWFPAHATTGRGRIRRALVYGGGLTTMLAGVVGVAQALHQPLLIPPLGATSILLLTAPDKPIAQPRTIMGGYLLAVGVAVGCGAWLAPSAWVAAAAAGVAAALLLVTNTLHPPGVATLLLLLLASTPPTWRVLVVPVLPGVGVVVGLGWLFNNVVAEHKYPATTWW